MESGESDSPIVHIRGLEKSYGPNGVLRGIDLDAHANEVLTLFGPNGAGKTTLLRILATLTRPDAGTVRIDGRDVARAGVFTRQITGVALHSPMLYGHLTARENLLFHARMFRVPRQAERVAEVASITQIEDRLDDQVNCRTVSNAESPWHVRFCTGLVCCYSTSLKRDSIRQPFTCWTESSTNIGKTDAL